MATPRLLSRRSGDGNDPLGTGGFELMKAHADGNPVAYKAAHGGKQMFAGMVFGLLIHSRRYSRPVGLQSRGLP